VLVVLVPVVGVGGVVRVFGVGGVVRVVDDGGFCCAAAPPEAGPVCVVGGGLGTGV
jgi:hypothetical protein